MHNKTLIPFFKLIYLNSLTLIYISSNSLLEIVLIPLITILLIGISSMVLFYSVALSSYSMWALVLLPLLITPFLNSNHPRGGLSETKVRLFGHLVLLIVLCWLVVGAFGSSISINSSSQSNLSHQHLSYHLTHFSQYSPINLLCFTSNHYFHFLSGAMMPHILG